MLIHFRRHELFCVWAGFLFLFSSNSWNCSHCLAEDSQFQTFSSYNEVGYNQSHRPQFHFTSRKNWINDPNGLVYHEGQYHLFFQHNPADVHWGNMTWGHAVSRDLIRWKQLPHAILPYGGGTIYSGTAAVDQQNTFGLQNGDTKTLVAAFTHAKEPFTQALAYSIDGGETFELWNKGEPIVANQGYDPQERDPKIFWHEPSRRWVMVLWVKQGNPGRVLFFNSTDLKSWEVVSHFDRDWVFECMDLVELPVDGNPNDTKWLLYDASFDYELGSFDGKSFTSDGKVQQGEYGPNYYAAQTFSNSPDGRTVMLGWMRGGEEAPFLRHQMPFNQQMSFPCTLELRSTPNGITVYRWPVTEIVSLYANSLVLTDCTLAAAQQRLATFEGELLDVAVEFVATNDTKFSLTLRGQQLRYQDGKFLYGDTHTPAAPLDGKVAVRVLVDRTSVEIFANRGQAVATAYADFNPSDHTISLASSEELPISRLEAHELRSSWNWNDEQNR